MRCLAIAAFAVASSLVRLSAAAVDPGMPEAPTIGGPERGSVAGALAHTAFGPTDLASGSFHLPLPLSIPTERGVPAKSPFPSYSPEGGLSEWGLGMSVDLTLRRFRARGDLDYATDDLASPWGTLRKGTDGAFYPTKTGENVRVVDDEGRFKAHLPDGSIWTFGATVRQDGRDGVFAWYLESCVSLAGETTNFTWSRNTSGRPFLDSVEYGRPAGLPSSRVRFVYETLKRPLPSYRTGKLELLDRRVSSVVAEARVRGATSFAPRWTYAIGYEEDLAGPAFRLSSLTRTFASGEAEPAARFSYAKPLDELAAVGHRRAPDLDSLTKRIGGPAPNLFGVLDTDDDGRPELELASDYTLVRRTDAGLVLEATTAAADADPFCRPAPSTSLPPRRFASMLGPVDSRPLVVATRFSSAAGQSALRVCERDGKLLAKTLVAGNWDLASGAQLVDVDRDLVPDMVRAYLGGVDVLPLAFDGTALQPGAVRSTRLTPAVEPASVTVTDMNGDGLVDLTARSDTGLTVWYGLGRGDFERQGTVYALRSTGGSVVSMGSARADFFDANNDGLTDILTSSPTGLALYVNTGKLFQQVDVPVFAKIGAGATTPVALDLLGTGNSALVFGYRAEGYAVELDSASTSLLVKADDGKGTVVSFEYGRADAAPGAGHRSKVLSRLRVKSVGHPEDVYENRYGTPKRHSQGRFLLGFERVSQTTSRGQLTALFAPDDNDPQNVLHTLVRDADAGTLAYGAAQTYEPFSLRGVSKRRLRSVANGWFDGGTGAPVLVESTENTAFELDVCLATSTTSSSAGTVTTTTKNERLPRFNDGLGCFVAQVTKSSKHGDASLDTVEVDGYDRDERGFVTRHVSKAGGVELEHEKRTYTADGLLATLTRPGRGTTTFSYEPDVRLPVGLVAPTGVTATILQRDALTDGVQGVRSTHGTLLHERYFRFDGLERLAKSWNNLGASTEADPSVAFAYRFADSTSGMSGLIRAATLASTGANGSQVTVTEDLVSAGGETLATFGKIPEGWASSLVSFSERSAKHTVGYVRGALATEPKDVKLDALYAASTLVSSSVETLLGLPLEQRSTFHEGVVKVVKGTVAEDKGVRFDLRENDARTTSRWLDASKRNVAYKDASGAEWKYAYDALGRLRLVRLPSGEEHRVDYDDYGRVKVIVRGGVARIEYRYDTAGQKSDELYTAATGGPALRSVHATRDAMGRVTREESTTPSGQSAAYEYYYDGATAEDPGAQDQLGFNTGVRGEGFQKTIRYRADGKPLATTLTIDGFRTLETTFAYDEDGAVRDRTTVVRDAAGGTVSSVVEGTARDAYARPARLLLQGETLATHGYDKDGRLSWLTFGSKHADDEVITLQYDAFTRRMNGMNVDATTWRSAVSTRFSDRGLVARETFDVGGSKRERVYAYGAAGYLESSSDAGDKYGYGYSTSGLLNRSSVGGQETTHTRSGSTLTVGGTKYTFDALGRVVSRGALTLTYGAHGHVQAASEGGRTWSYLYDETGRRLAKLEGGSVVGAYPADGSYLGAQTGLVAPMLLAGQVVGLVHHGLPNVPARYEAIATDGRGTRISTTGGAATFASPYGARAQHPELAAAIDYARKGWDPDLAAVRMGVRDYDPALGLFLQPDPAFLAAPDLCVSNPVECALYGYAKNDPVGRWDPDGTQSLEAPGVSSTPTFFPTSTPTDVVIKDPAYHWTRAGFPGPTAPRASLPAAPSTPALLPGAGAAASRLVLTGAQVATSLGIVGVVSVVLAADPPAWAQLPLRPIKPYDYRSSIDGFQWHHINQNAAYSSVIPSGQGISIPLQGSINEPGSEHYRVHYSLERFWDQFREGGAREGERPLNQEYHEAVFEALTDIGIHPTEAGRIVQAAREQAESYGLKPMIEVPRVPDAIKTMKVTK